MPITCRPAPTTGTTARTESVGLPWNVSVKVLPAMARPISCAGVPISRGSGSVSRTPRLFSTEM